MGKSGFKGGEMYASNDQGGVVSVSTNASGNGTASVSFRQRMNRATYGIQLSPLQSGSEVWSTGVMMAGTRTTSGFAITLRGANTTSSVVKISYHAFDDSAK